MTNSPCTKCANVIFNMAPGDEETCPHCKQTWVADQQGVWKK